MATLAEMLAGRTKAVVDFDRQAVARNAERMPGDVDLKVQAGENPEVLFSTLASHGRKAVKVRPATSPAAKRVR